MRRSLTHEEFINRLPLDIKKNFNIIDTYINRRTKIIIEDNLNIQYKVNPGELLNGDTPTIRMAIDKDDAISKQILDKFKGKYTVISKYNGDKALIIVKDNLGIEYSTTPNNLKSIGVTKLSINSAKNVNKAFELKANSIHNNLYKYNNINYINNESIIKIICKKHGEFKQTAQSHLAGRGCPICGNIKDGDKILGFKKKQWINFYKNKPNRPNPVVYIIKIFDEDEEFIKIGRTYKSVNKRFGKGNTKALPYQYSILATIPGKPAFIFDLENKLHKDFKQFTYKPLKYFGGNTECFSLRILTSLKEIKYV